MTKIYTGQTLRLSTMEYLPRPHLPQHRSSDPNLPSLSGSIEAQWEDSACSSLFQSLTLMPSLQASLLGLTEDWELWLLYATISSSVSCPSKQWLLLRTAANQKETVDG
ncbi:UNVERIFIED_CONTAM: hypothetical protein K2H54_024992 [Gekko kuhli]